MTPIQLFERFGLQKVHINFQFAKFELDLNTADRDAAWDLYVEMLTRITTQPLPSDDGDEAAALTSVHSLFATTREILRRPGPKPVEFSKIAIPVLNQVVRPFTAKWHRKKIAGELNTSDGRKEFRAELEYLQIDLIKFSRIIAEIAEVEDLTQLELPDGEKS